MALLIYNLNRGLIYIFLGIFDITYLMGHEGSARVACCAKLFVKYGRLRSRKLYFNDGIVKLKCEVGGNIVWLDLA